MRQLRISLSAIVTASSNSSNSSPILRRSTLPDPKPTVERWPVTIATLVGYDITTLKGGMDGRFGASERGLWFAHIDQGGRALESILPWSFAGIALSGL